MGRRLGLAPPDDVIWGLADTIFGEQKSACFLHVCAYTVNLYDNMGYYSNTHVTELLASTNEGMEKLFIEK